MGPRLRQQSGVGIGAVRSERITLSSLPRYPPELKPDESLNRDLELKGAKRAPARQREELLETATPQLRSLQRRPEQGNRFFRHPRVRHTAWCALLEGRSSRSYSDHSPSCGFHV